ncbi:MAG: alpha/beta fold hydrolase [Acidobacteriota bacterium]|nr:alpha/beta fold hydrolase [Acidobacteriota bacterium]
MSAVVLLAAGAGAAQSVPVPDPGEGSATFTIFAGNTPIGTEETTVTKLADGWRISSSGSQRAPAALVLNDLQLTLGTDWHPRELKLEALLRGQPIASTTTFGVTTAVTDYVQNGQRGSTTNQITARTVVLPNAFYAPYEALAARLGALSAGSSFRIFVAPQPEIDAVVKSVTEQKVSTTGGTVSLRRYEITVTNPGGNLDITVDVDGRRRLARVVIPSVQLSVVREDLASVSSRPETYRNPGDENVFVPALGFNLAATLTRPPGAPAKAPAVVLIAGSGATDRDETAHGIPIFGQLAGELAKAGYLVLRYDKRGVGQSGGRFESATLTDYAEDVRAAVTFLARRKDVDKDRIAVVGHSEGAAVALIAASREKKIKAAALVAGPGTTGYELILEQQRHELERMKVPQAERDQKVAFQRQLMDASVSGKGLDAIPIELRRSVESPWFRSLLLFDPAAVISKVRQPLLIVQPRLDTQVRPHHGEKLAALANQRRKSAPTELVMIDGVNHLLVAAKTGETAEYPALSGSVISARVAEAIVAFLNRALALR